MVSTAGPLHARGHGRPLVADTKRQRLDADIETRLIWHHDCGSPLLGARKTRMEFQDYYETLGVSRSASDAEIKAAYRKLARQYHPDRNTDSGAEDRFKAISEAYEVLKDPAKRQQYDALGANWQNGQQFRPPPGWDAGAGGFGGASGFSDFFETLFGQGFQAGDFGGQNPFGGRAARPSPQTARISISLEDAFNGIKRRLTLNDSQGARQVDVQIPKGIRSGQKIRLSGQGRAPVCRPDRAARLPAKGNRDAILQAEAGGPTDDPAVLGVRGRGHQRGMRTMHGVAGLVLVTMHHDRDRPCIGCQCIRERGQHGGIVAMQASPIFGDSDP